MTCHLVVNLPRWCISFEADYDMPGCAIDNGKELWNMLKPEMKSELMVPADDDTYFGVYDNTCGEGEWLWQPDPGDGKGAKA